MASERFSLAGRTAIVTGGSRGIGRAVALAFAEHGADVAVASRKRAGLEAVKTEIERLGRNSLAIPCHMGKAEDVKNLAARVLDAWGRVDILVNNAATNPVFGPFVETDESAWEKVMDVNLKGPFLLSKAVAASMIGHRAGKIINVSSNEALVPNPNLGTYSISKAALITQTRVLARDLGKHGICVNCIAPGLVETRFASALFEDQQLYEYYMNKIALQRHGQPDDIAGTAVFLASDASNFMTGHTLVVDGGEIL